MNALDSSVVLAVIRKEPGASDALEFFEHSLMSAVNLAETLQKAAQYGMGMEQVRDLLQDAGIGIVPFDDTMAASTAALWPLTKNSGLSLGDRACLALAEAVSGIAVTTDKAWADLDLPGIDIHLVTR